MFTLGISAFYHDSAAALLKDGLIIAAVQKSGLREKSMMLDFLSMPFDIASKRPTSPPTIMRRRFL